MNVIAYEYLVVNVVESEIISPKRHLANDFASEMASLARHLANNAASENSMLNLT